MKIAIASSSLLALPTISTLERSNHSIVGVITNPDKPSGRGRVLTPNPLAENLAHSSLTLFKPSTHSELSDVVRELAPELVVTIAYGRIIRSESLVLPRFGWINLHFSLLPAYRGAAPVQRAILDGAHETGVSVFQLDPGMDTGDIFATQVVAIEEDETAGELLTRLSHTGAHLILTTLAAIEQKVQPTPQSSTGISLAPKIEVAEAKINWGLGSDRVHRLIRAMTPEPGAWTLLNGQRFVIGKCSRASEILEPGEIVHRENQLFVGTGDGSIHIQQLQPSGKRTMTSAEWLRGARLGLDSRFE